MTISSKDPNPRSVQGHRTRWLRNGSWKVKRGRPSSTRKWIPVETQRKDEIRRDAHAALSGRRVSAAGADEVLPAGCARVARAEAHAIHELRLAFVDRTFATQALLVAV